MECKEKEEERKRLYFVSGVDHKIVDLRHFPVTIIPQQGIGVSITMQIPQSGPEDC